MSELADRIRDALGSLRARDPKLARFGAAHHRYELAPPRAAPELPAELATFVSTVGASGAGPGYGLIGGGTVVAHLGCGYAAVVADTGEVWIDAKSISVTEPIAPSFTAWYLAWLDGDPASHIPPGVCALPNALAGFLAIHEHDGPLTGDPLRQVLNQLDAHSIEIAAESSLLFPTGTRVDPCIECARLVEKLGPDGLRADVIKPP